MANTFTSLRYHIAFSTKQRKRWIAPEIEERVWSYLGGIAERNGMQPLAIGGVDDHVHLLLGIPPKLAVSDAVKYLKGGSSKWFHETFPQLLEFGWQDGYGAFTVGRSQIEATEEYIRGQRDHHRVQTFEEEYLAFLRKHELSFDPRHVFD
ncbi:MAG: IS200/IS605 family transposase [Planctomycetia bacterium]|nr:IS200/IS605 family transposase [Planctomycetia bacterium]